MTGQMSSLAKEVLIVAVAAGAVFALFFAFRTLSILANISP